MSDIKVDLIDTMGSDLSVVNAARVSFSKVSKGVIEWHDKGNGYAAPVNVPTEADEKLIKYLAKHNHWSPFAHAFLSFRIKAPIFVARQLVKHQVGLAWNEVSRRYVDDEPEFYVPEVWRKKAENVKQGSSNDGVIGQDKHNAEVGLLYDLARETYSNMLLKGVAPEQARMVLPLSTMTEWIWSGSLMAFVRVCKLRLDPHAQQECREVVKLIAEYVEQEFPVSYKALMENT